MFKKAVFIFQSLFGYASGTKHDFCVILDFPLFKTMCLWQNVCFHFFILFQRQTVSHLL